jgi:hypothetical protein
MEHPQSEKTRLNAIRAEREYVLAQIRQSELIVERTQELIKRIDELLAKDGVKS